MCYEKTAGELALLVDLSFIFLLHRVWQDLSETFSQIPKGNDLLKLTLAIDE